MVEETLPTRRTTANTAYARHYCETTASGVQRSIRIQSIATDDPIDRRSRLLSLLRKYTHNGFGLLEILHSEVPGLNKMGHQRLHPAPK